MSFKPLFSVILAGALLVTAACDPSKPELDKTKTELTTVSAERDSLKAQLEQANGKVATLTQQLADANAKAAAAAAPAPPPEPEPEKKGAGKHPAKPAAKPETPAAMVETKKVTTGKSRF
jgi:hypothetical protein